MSRLILLCASESGFTGTLNTEVQGDFYLEFNADDERAVLLDSVLKDCRAELVAQGLVQDLSQPQSPEQLRSRYAYLLEAAACLEAEGIPISDPPSIQAYVESEGFAWVPHAEISDSVSSGERINEIMRACPQ